jgi:excinuclease ABC subunit A
MAVPLKQLNFNVNPRSTVMSYFDLQKFVIYVAGSVTGLSLSDFNYNGNGRCRECKGLGYKLQPDPVSIIDYDKKICEVPFKCWQKTYVEFFKQLLTSYCDECGINKNKRFKELSEQQKEQLLYGIGEAKQTFKYKAGGRVRSKTSCYIGPITGLDRKSDVLFSYNREQYCTQKKCECCGGSRLRAKTAAKELIKGFSVGDLYTENLDSLENNLLKLKKGSGKDLQSALDMILSFIAACKKVGLGYLELTRSISSLSGGELQRLRIAQLLVGKMHGLLIVLDEPTTSLYPSEADFIIDIMEEMREKNTLLVVEHNKKVIEKADHNIYLGHDGGKNGGYLISKAEYMQLQEDSLRYQFFKGSAQDFCMLNSDYIDYAGSKLEIPHGSILGLCGMSGCGKTTILKEILPKYYENYLYVSQKPLKGNSFTTVATYTKVLNEIRSYFAKVLGKDKGYFSQRGKGACETCGGTGIVEIGSFYEEKLFDTCDKCNGTGYLQEVLSWKVDGMNIYDIQQMTVDEILSSKLDISAKAKKMIELLSDIGLGYLKLSQKIKTLSGGENQRIKLAEALNDNKYAMIGLDEPAKGLGHRETAGILRLIYNQISKNKKTFIIAEHDTMFLNYCSYFAELRRKGRSTSIVFQGNREQLFKDKKNDIHNWLAADLEEFFTRP